MRASVVKWLEALRSGEFEQCSGRLEYGGKFCCLGVACVVAELEDVPVNRHSEGRLCGTDLYDQPYVKIWLGLKTGIGVIPFESGHNLVLLNDSGETFAEIADVIEKNYDTLFTPEGVTT